MLEKARARGKDLVQRQAGLLQGDGPKKSNIEVRPPPEGIIRSELSLSVSIA